LGPGGALATRARLRPSSEISTASGVPRPAALPRRYKESEP